MATHYTINYNGADCTLSDIRLNKEETFIFPQLPNHDKITCLIIKNSTIPLLSEDLLKSFPNLKTFQAVNVGIEEISEDAFVDIKHLKKILLNDNCIQELPMNLFNRNSALEKLDLTKNKIESLPTELFYDLNNLRCLVLDCNKLTKLSKKLFRDLKNLEYFSVSHNELLELNIDQILVQLPKLKEFYIQDNNFDLKRVKYIVDTCKKAQVEIKLFRSSEYQKKKRVRSLNNLCVYEGVEYIPEIEYERLLAQKKILKLESKLRAVQEKVDLMQNSLTFLMNEHEIQKAKGQDTTSSGSTSKVPFTIVRAEDLEEELQKFMKSVKV